LTDLRGQNNIIWQGFRGFYPGRLRIPAAGASAALIQCHVPKQSAGLSAVRTVKFCYGMRVKIEWCLAALLYVIAMCLTVSRVAGQGATGTILGTVTDMSGAFLPEASIQVRNAGTGAVQSVPSDSQGRFRVADLAVGEYEVQALKTGFSTVVRKGIVLNVGAQMVVDFSLPVTAFR
jgi:hypothetical protein